MRLGERCLLLLLSTATSPATTFPEVPCRRSACLVLMILDKLWIAWQLNLEGKLSAFCLVRPSLIRGEMV